MFGLSVCDILERIKGKQKIFVFNTGKQIPECKVIGTFLFKFVITLLFLNCVPLRDLKYDKLKEIILT